jgi:hypothetical protein
MAALILLRPRSIDGRPEVEQSFTLQPVGYSLPSRPEGVYESLS